MQTSRKNYPKKMQILVRTMMRCGFNQYCPLCPGLPLPPPSLHILNFMPDLTGLCKWLRLIFGQGQIARADVFVLGFHASLSSLWLNLASYNGYLAFNQTNLKTDTCICHDEPDSQKPYNCLLSGNT